MAITETPFCSGSNVLCTSGQVASCSNQNDILGCSSGTPQCCDNMSMCNTNIDCAAASSSSSSSGVSCVGGTVTCPIGRTPQCSLGVPQCINNVPTCCNNNDQILTRVVLRYQVIPNQCDSSLLTCEPIMGNPPPNCSWTMCGNNCCIFGCCGSNPGICSNSLECVISSSSSGASSSSSSSGSSGEATSSSSSSGGLVIDQFSTSSSSSGSFEGQRGFDIDVVSSPRLPRPPLIPDEFLGKIGIAYPGSNPSFEIKSSLSLIETEILSLSLTGSNGITFSNVQYDLMNISNESNKYIFNLLLPDGISAGNAIFSFNLNNGLSLSGIIKIIDFNPLINPVVIRRLSLNVQGRKATVTLRGNSNSGNSFAATIFPSNITNGDEQVTVKKNGIIIVKFSLSGSMIDPTDSVLILATERSIVSKDFAISNRSRKSRTKN